MEARLGTELKEQFLRYIVNVGTGGNGWVCSDDKKQWIYGYATLISPEPLLQIQRFTAPLSNFHSVSVQAGVDEIPANARFIGFKVRLCNISVYQNTYAGPR